MGASIRKTKTSSGATAVQVVRYEKRKLVIMRHIGSGHSHEEVSALVESALVWIKEHSKQTMLFEAPPRRTLSLTTTELVGTAHTFAREVLLLIAQKIGFGALPPLLLDLAIMRLIEPCSKLRSFELLTRYFDVSYIPKTAYRVLRTFGIHQTVVEDVLVQYARKQRADDLTLVLYDVTTLYFETHAEDDDLRARGFSKDNKVQQPQLVVGLLVSREGFPLGYEVFKGNTFEGHTMLPVLDAFGKRHGVKTPTVVADAGMLSRENVMKLETGGYAYIVGARLGNLPPKTLTSIGEKMSKTDGAILRLSTDHGDLIVSFSEKRYKKDKGDMERQWKRATALVEKSEPGRRAKFIRKEGGKYLLNDDLKKKTETLLGLKGYHTNIPESDMASVQIIERYHDLWRVEASFRMAKNDLATRPIFHHTDEAIRAHLLICVVALAIAKSIELTVGTSLRNVRDALWSITDATLRDTVTGETFTLRSEITDSAKDILQKIKVRVVLK